MGGQGSHNKPIDCSAFETYAAGPDDKEEDFSSKAVWHAAVYGVVCVVNWVVNMNSPL
jgi:hypothetical protein